MADGSKIEWTDATWNPIRGCSRVSEGCRNCYAERVAARFSGDGQPYAGLADRTAKGPRWTGKVRLVESALDQPLRWRRPRRVFVNSMSDLFHEDVADRWIDRIFAVMDAAPQHVYQVLTKRPIRMWDFLSRRRAAPPVQPYIGGGLLGYMPFNREIEPPRNIWLGVSVEDQATANARVPVLLQTPAAVRFVSAEPLLGPVDLEPWLAWPDDRCHPAPRDDEPFGCLGCDTYCPECPQNRAVYTSEEGPRDADGCPEWVNCERITLDWIIVGGESGPHARPIYPDWARSLRDQCEAAGVPFFFKQWGEWSPVPEGAAHPLECAPVNGRHGTYDVISQRGRPLLNRVGKARAGRLLDGREHNGMPGSTE